MVISNSCGDGDFPPKKLVKWLFRPQKVGDLILSCGDGDFWAFRDFSPELKIINSN